MLAEVVSGTVKVQIRELADVGSFLADDKRIVLGKARQLYITGGLPAAPAPTAILPGQGPAVQDLPIVVISGQFPVNPLTVRYINEQLTAEGHRPDGTVQPLTVLDLEQLEGCQALLQRKGHTLPQLLDAWRHSPYRDAAFRNYLAHEIGGQELGRLDDVRAALTESFQVIQQLLGTPGAWTPVESPPDRT